MVLKAEKHAKEAAAMVTKTSEERVSDAVKAEPVARVRVYMWEGRRQFSVNELGTKAAGELPIGVYDLYAAPPTSELETLRKERDVAVAAMVRNNERAETAEARLAEAMKALDEALVGLDAGCSQYVNRTISGAEVPGDEQYPWVRLMQIGRDAARRVREGGKVDG